MKNLVFSALAAGFLCACGTVAVRVPVMRPAEINMAPYQSVAIGDMSGGGNHPMTDSLEEALVNTNRFTVVDRQHMSQLMRELRLSSSDLADPSAAAKLGRVVAAGALIFGDVQTNYREQRRTGEEIAHVDPPRMGVLPCYRRTGPRSRKCQRI